MKIQDIVAALLNEEDDTVGEFFAAVACVEHRGGRWLLGLSTASDDRKHMSVSPEEHSSCGNVASAS